MALASASVCNEAHILNHAPKQTCEYVYNKGPLIYLFVLHSCLNVYIEIRLFIGVCVQKMPSSITITLSSDIYHRAAES